MIHSIKKYNIRFIVFFCVLFWAISFTGCGNTDAHEENQSASNAVELTVWGAEEDQELLSRIIDDFKKEHSGEADFHITLEVQGESECKDVLLGGLEAGADIFTFADDQLNALVAAGALDPVEGAQQIRSENLDTAVEAASVGNTLYAYPLTADNGYFLYYNKEYFKDSDVETLDKILSISGEKGKRFTMDWSSAWYVYSFFGNTGMEVKLSNDGITNECSWNNKKGEVKGVDVAKAMLEIGRSSGFANCTDAEFLAGVKDGSVIAGVSGVWNAVEIEKAWGKDTGACKLPTYTCKGKQIQMASFSGCKLIGVNAYSKSPKWAKSLAEWITNEQNQKLRFEMRGQGPANKNAAASSEVQASPAIAALLQQSEFAQLQRVGGKFWDPVAAFAQNMAAGNSTGEDLQKQMDKMVKGITMR